MCGSGRKGWGPLQGNATLVNGPSVTSPEEERNVSVVTTNKSPLMAFLPGSGEVDVDHTVITMHVLGGHEGLHEMSPGAPA